MNRQRGSWRTGWRVAAVVLGSATVVGGLVAPLAGATAQRTPTPFLDSLHAISQIGSTVPANGDVNPYGVAVVPTSVGKLVAGDTLVSNFNSKANVQGTGTTIVEVSPSGSTTLFAQIASFPSSEPCPGGVGLSTALAILPGRWVVVGSLPTSAGGALPKDDPAGCLIVLNEAGSPVETLSNKDIVGPWDMMSTSSSTTATLYISNALGGNTRTHQGVPVAGNCTIARLELALHPGAPPVLSSSTVIGWHFPWRANKAALVLAPTGLALGVQGTLFVDDSQTDSISAISDASTRTHALSASASTITTGHGLDAPLGMLTAPGGDLVVVNGNNGNAVEFSPTGRHVVTKTLVKSGGGDLFGIALSGQGGGLLFVNDGTNALDLARG